MRSMIFREAGMTKDPTQPFCAPPRYRRTGYPPFANINAKITPSNRDDISHW
jgi:hypothetical protein